jgi:hypothetical protein
MPSTLDVVISMWDDRWTIDGICRLLTFAFPLAADRMNSRPFTQQALRTLTGQM